MRAADTRAHNSRTASVVHACTHERARAPDTQTHLFIHQEMLSFLHAPFCTDVCDVGRSGGGDGNDIVLRRCMRSGCETAVIIGRIVIYMNERSAAAPDTSAYVNGAVMQLNPQRIDLILATRIRSKSHKTAARARVYCHGTVISKVCALSIFLRPNC